MGVYSSIMKKDHVGIVGSGIGGLATAIRLAAKGYRVEVFEKNSFPGGKIAEYRKDGFRFDMGPSLFTMPHWVEELFELAGQDMSSVFSYHALEESCTYFYEDGTVFHAYNDPSRFAKELADKAHIAPGSLEKYLEKAAFLYNTTEKVFIRNSLHRLSNYISPDFLKAYLKIYKIDGLTSLHNRNQKSFDDPRVVQLFDRYATYVGSDPFRTPATLKMISHLEHNIGAFFPDEGMYGIVKALHRLGESMGVTYHFNAPVTRILHNGNASGIAVDNEKYSFDHVISNADVYFSNKLLLGESYAPKVPDLHKFSTSALIFYWGINKNFPQLSLHNILFANDYKREFNILNEGCILPDDPTVYISISSRSVPTDAPAGMENWFVMINVPPYFQECNPDIIKEVREHIVSKINTFLNTRIEEHILFEHRLTPQGIEARTSSFRGALYGLNSNNRFNAFLRHSNFSKKLRNLYFVGGSVHPGGGIPMCLSSARIVAEEFKPV